MPFTTYLVYLSFIEGVVQRLKVAHEGEKFAYCSYSLVEVMITTGKQIK